MFMLRNVSKYLFGDTSKETIAEIPQGQLFLVRPKSPKGYSELIFKDAVASIRRTGQDFQYQLVIQRAYEEGEEELLTDEEAETEAISGSGLGLDKDEKVFLLDEGLRFTSQTRQSGERVFAWRDLSGDPDDLFEFVCDRSVQPENASQVQDIAARCQYERKYKRSSENASESDLLQLYFTEVAIPPASPEESPVPAAQSHFRRSASPIASISAKMPSNANSSVKRNTTSSEQATPQGNKGHLDKGKATVAPPSTAQPEVREILAQETAELHLFDFQTSTFVIQDRSVTATVSNVGDWDYWLQINGATRDWLGQPVIADVNPVFNFEYLSFIFNHYTKDGSAYSWLLRFRDQETEERFQQGLMLALWEHLNHMKWSKTKTDERDYVLDAFNDLSLEDPVGNGNAEEDEEPESEEEDNEAHQRREEYDTDESEDETEGPSKDGEINSQLAVGYKHDRSFVVRGSKIGVFKHTPDNHLEFSTNISKVQTPKGKLFNPSKVMLHAEDRNMVLQDVDNPNSLYRMDLEYGKVVDEWRVHDDIPVTTFAPEKKFAQMTGEQTFLGLSGNALYRIDPRLSGNKLVDSELKQYVSKNKFSAAATTEKGHIAVVSDKGDIRLFDRLGINAKTLIPALGDPMIGVDVSADGRWLLATTRTYLLLVDALQKEGKNEGKLGFEKPFGKDSKPQPRRLALSPNHVAQFQHETGTPILFTKAYFNTGVESNETSIITATGPFIVTWNMKKVLEGRKDPYNIKRYTEEVKADNFTFGSDKNLIVALPNEVNVIAKKALRRPTRESIATPARVGVGRRGGGRLSDLRNEIVNSPY